MFLSFCAGDGGIGKSSSLGILALDWAEGVAPELQQFNFIFLILLRHVNTNKSLEDIILEQHGTLKSIDITNEEIKEICREGGAMIIFDGLDEYAQGTNSEIDNILLHGKVNCFVIISSRSGDFLQPIRKNADEEVRIEGFTEENIEICAAQYLGSKETCLEFFYQARRVGLQPLLHVPIILLMACSVFIQNKSLPRSKTELFAEITNMSISRTTLKMLGKNASEIEDLQGLKM